MSNLQKRLSVAALMSLMLVCVGVDAKGSSGGGHSYSGGFSSGRSSSPSSSSSHAYSGGFSSGRSSSSSAPAAPARSYNSFGSSKSTSSAGGDTAPASGSAAPTGPRSALSAGLDKNASQANALKSLDARNAKKDPAYGAAVPQQSSNSGMQAAPAPSYQSPGYAPAPVPYSGYGQQSRPSSGGFSWGSAAMGFMLGHAMSGEHRNYDQGGYSNNHGYDQSGQANGAPYNGGGIGSTLLRIFLWLLILGAIGWAVWFFAFRKKPVAASTTSFYKL